MTFNIVVPSYSVDQSVSDFNVQSSLSFPVFSSSNSSLSVSSFGSSVVDFVSSVVRSSSLSSLFDSNVFSSVLDVSVSSLSRSYVSLLSDDSNINSSSLDTSIVNVDFGESIVFNSRHSAVVNNMVRVGNVNVILFDETSRLRPGDYCFLVCSIFFFRIVHRNDVVDCIMTPVGRIYNVFDRNVSIDLSSVSSSWL